MIKMHTVPYIDRSDPERKMYPVLNDLVSLYFFQDYDLISEDPDEIVRVFKFEHEASSARELAADIERFLAAYGATEEELAAAFMRVFRPEMSIYGWNHRTLREALSQVAKIVLDPAAPGRPRP